MRDATAIWFVQRIGPATHLIDFVQESGAGIEYYVGLLKDRAKTCGYHYGHHYVPHDAAASNIQTGKSLVDVASEAGLWLDVVQRGDVAPRRSDGSVGDGQLTVADVARLLRHLVGLESTPWP